MGKISSYARVLAAKLADVFVVDQTDNGTTETKSATVEQIGTAIGTLQNFADLDTSNKKLVDAINEVNDKADTNTTAIGDLSDLTTTNNDSLVDAVNEVDSKIDGLSSVNLDFSISCRTSATGICPYRSSGSEAVNITTLAGYPTGKTILAVIPQYSYLAGSGNMSQPCLVNVYGTTIYVGSYASGDVDVRVTVLYK